MSSNTIYVTYLTIYYGSKLPMFYIGSSSLERINKGYRGSVSSKKYKKIWKMELKSNPQLFKTKVITKHNTRQDALNNEFKFQKFFNIAKTGMYINMAICNVNGSHAVSLKGKDSPNYGIVRSDEYKRNQSNIHKSKNLTGKNHFNFGRIRSIETRLKIGKAGLGRIPHNKGKKSSPETVEKNRLAKLGTVASEQSKYKVSSKIIYEFKNLKTGEILIGLQWNLKPILGKRLVGKLIYGEIKQSRLGWIFSRKLDYPFC